MIGPPRVIAEATCCAELVAAFHTRAKEDLALSNAALDHLLNQSSGHADKVWSGTRSLSADMLDKMLSRLGLKLLVAIDPDGVARISHRWERRNEQAVRAAARVGKELIARAADGVAPACQQGSDRALEPDDGRKTPGNHAVCMDGPT
jgi:hypothetical protein